MASDRYVNADNDRTPSGISWRVGTWGDKLYVYVGGALVSLEGEQRDRFAEAVARAVTPGQVNRKRGNHGPGCGCTPCKAEPSYQGHGQAAP
jgi:hypothetical protein